ncbi:MAG TPA: MBL fold metallo-hydrolase, partial [Candidatus Egerieimonas faecigallinarum]|nr:MBL fold metallo-hydrolase [Candidatus Egerieimonas faecigallinarum]
MYSVRNVSEDLFWIGADDRRLALFENIFPIPRGVSYNAYVLMDEKTALLDTADYSVGRQFRENLDHVLGGRSLDYVIVNHMEPDHCALLADIARDYPDAVFVGNAKTFQMISQFYQLDLTGRNLVVKEGDTLTLGKHTLTFVMAPMVHWPEA